MIYRFAEITYDFDSDLMTRFRLLSIWARLRLAQSSNYSSSLPEAARTERASAVTHSFILRELVPPQST